MASKRILVTLLLALMPLLATAEGLPSTLQPKQAVNYLYVDDIAWVDVRKQKEWDAGHLAEAVHLPVKEVASRAATVLPNKDQQIITYCAVGYRAAKAKRELLKMGYTNVSSVVAGGYKMLEKFRPIPNKP